MNNEISKVLRGTPKHLSRTGQLEGFVYLMLTLPFKCNYRCLKCFDLIGSHPAVDGRPITLKEILSVINEAKAIGGKAVVIAGDGEPTLSPNIKSIISRIDDLGMIPIVYSNGSTLGPDIASFYHDYNVCLVIALDSLRADVYERLTVCRPGMFVQVLRNLDNLRRIYADTVKQQGGLRIVRLALNMTVCSRNKDEVEAIKEYTGEDMYFVCNPLARWGNAAGNWNLLVDSDEDFAEHEEKIRRYSESGGPLMLDRAGVCGYSINGIGIGPFGHYMTCAYTVQTNGLLGTIHDKSLKEAYEYKAAVEREYYKKHERVPCLVRAEFFRSFVETLRLNFERN
jgi:MoaA/NifB/PqqE/SkfB family radical SAM enzyme